MKKTNFTFLLLALRNTFLVLLLLLGIHGISDAQCSLGCNGNIQVSLDNANCEAVVTPSMVLNGQNTTCPNGSFIVELRFNGVLLPLSPKITHEYVGKTLEAKVIDVNSGNSCWGWLHVEDKLPPTITCPGNTSIYCYQLPNFAPTVFENCGPFTLNITNEAIVTNNCNNGFGEEVLKTITRTYRATDASGNVSLPCTFTFSVNRIPSLLDITVPPNRLFPSNNLQCDAIYQRDAEGHPHPSVTGAPTLYGFPLWPDPDFNCNLLVDYTDVVLPPIACVTKIMRTWTIIEWSCSNPQRTRTFVQMIEIADSVPPVITGAKDLTVSTSAHECEAHFNVPPVVVTDNCGSVTVTISGGSSIIIGNGGVTTLPVGTNILIYRATDHCGNVSTATINVYVEDLTPPVAVCDQGTTIGLTSDGLAWVHASVFDDGSYDECQLSKMLVRRMDQVCTPCKEPEFPGFKYLGTTDGHYYYLSNHRATPRLAYKCAKAMGGYMASLETAAEATWLYNQVHTYSDTLDYLIGLNDKFVEGQFAWDNGSTSTYRKWFAGQPDGSGDYAYVEATNSNWYDTPGDAGEYKYVIEITDPCGWSSYAKFCCADVGNANIMVAFRVIDAACNYNECMVRAEVQDKLPPSIICPADRTVNCDYLYDILNLSNFFGNATAIDNCTSTLSETVVNNLNQCNVGTLVRTFIATDAGQRKATCNQIITFYNDDPFYINQANPFDPNDDVIWPADIIVDGCDDPNSDDYLPSITGRPIFTQDQCDLVGADYDDKIFTFNNPIGEACFKIIRTWTVIDWCQFSQGNYYEWTYQQIIKVHNKIKPTIVSSCARKETCTFDADCISGFIELTARATDDCTALLAWTYKVDIDNDGDFDAGYTHSGIGNDVDASGEYPIGSHRILWTFEDKCGNATSCEQLFDVLNCKAPTPYLINGLAVGLMPMDTNGDGNPDDGMVQLWASDFDRGSFHPCGYHVILSFSLDITNTSITFDCSDVGRQTVNVYATIVTPQGNQIYAYATTFVDIQDNQHVCDPTNTRVAINGKIVTPQQENLANAEVRLNGTEQMVQMTSVEGEYAFPAIEVGGAFEISPVKTDDYANGITTLDLVLIQRHILSIAKLNSAYNIIAADINKDKKVNTADLVQLRKLILGSTDKFDNTSWRFIDKNYAFQNANSPLDEVFAESYIIPSLSSDMKIDFTAVKVGDVNGSVLANLNSKNLEPRTNSKLIMSAQDVDFKEGELVTLNLNTEAVQDLFGFQFTLNFNTTALDLVNIEGGDILLNDENLGLRYVDKGLVGISWNDQQAVSVSNVMKITFKAKQKGSLLSSIGVSSDLTKAEAYNANTEIMDIELRSVNNHFALYQNNPNPFSTTTDIAFELPISTKVNFKVFDVTGKILKVISNEYSAGRHTITLDKNLLHSSGVLYYQIEAGDFSATKKMVIID